VSVIVYAPRCIDIESDVGLEQKAKDVEKQWHYKQTAGPFDKLRAGPSTAPLAMRLRETPLRMTIYMSIHMAICRYTWSVRSKSRWRRRSGYLKIKLPICSA